MKQNHLFLERNNKENVIMRNNNWWKGFKQEAIKIVISCLFLIGCEKEIKKEDLIYAIPNSKQTNIAFKKITEKIGVPDPLLYEFKIDFEKADKNKTYNVAKFTVVAEKQEKTFIEYTYHFPTGEIEKGEESRITVMPKHQSYNELMPYKTYQDASIHNLEAALDPESYKLFTFKKNEIPGFTKLDSVYKVAILQSGFEPNTAYIKSIRFSQNKSYSLISSLLSPPTTVITVKNTKNILEETIFDVYEGNELIKRDENYKSLKEENDEFPSSY